jgi:serine/threonine-protein kinase
MLGRVFLGRYETISLLGEGGMGRVYLAHQKDLGRQVVVKIMHDHVAADPKFRERFTRETLLMARFQHPYAVTLYDATLDDPQGPCIVMEYIRGVTLDVLLHSHGRLPAFRVSRLLRQLCEALHAAHEQNIIHRDLKPANIMVVDRDTPYELVKVMDFGLAKLVAPDPIQVSVTNSEFAVGTPGYMCPEQARGEDMDHRGDLYSVGVILYELLTGRLPFAGGSTMDVLLAHATEEPPPFARVAAAAGVPRAVEQVVQLCLSKDPSQRPAHARDLAERFEEAVRQSTAAVEPRTNLESTPSPRRQRQLLVASRMQPALATTCVPTDAIAGAATAAAAAAAEDIDPLAIVHQLEAWMPEKIAAYKLRGFIGDAGGDVLESVPGRIRVRLGGKGCVYNAPARGLTAWLGLGRRSGQIDMELRLVRPEGARENQLRITVVLKAPGVEPSDPTWQTVCTQIYCDLRGYLMGQNGPPPDPAV